MLLDFNQIPNLNIHQESEMLSISSIKFFKVVSNILNCKDFVFEL